MKILIEDKDWLQLEGCKVCSISKKSLESLIYYSSITGLNIGNFHRFISTNKKITKIKLYVGYYNLYVYP